MDTLYWESVCYRIECPSLLDAHKHNVDTMSLQYNYISLTQTQLTNTGSYLRKSHIPSSTSANRACEGFDDRILNLES